MLDNNKNIFAETFGYNQNVFENVVNEGKIADKLKSLINKKKKEEPKPKSEKPKEYVVPKVSPKEAYKKYTDTFRKELNALKINNDQITLNGLKKCISYENPDSDFIYGNFDKCDFGVCIYFSIWNYPNLKEIAPERSLVADLSGECFDILTPVANKAFKAVGDNSYIHEDGSGGDWDTTIYGIEIKQK